MNQISKLKSIYTIQCRSFANKGIFKNLIDNFRKEYESDKQIKENVEKFKKSTQDLEESQEFKKIREMYKKLEKEIPHDTSDKILHTYRNLLERVQKETDQLKKIEIFKKGINNVSKMTEMLPKDVKLFNYEDSKLLKQAFVMADLLEKEVRSERSKMYQSPATLRTRNEVAGLENEHRKIFEPNESVTGMELHKDSRWISSWSDFKDNNQYMQKLFNLKTQFDESDSLPVRSVRWFTDKISDRLTRMGENEMTSVIKEIHKIDSSFSTEDFLRFCQFEVIPNVLESIIQGNTHILKDWCHEGLYNMLSAPIIEAKKNGYIFESRILDVDHVELIMGRMMEQSPILIIGFDSKQLEVVKNSSGKVVQGDPHKVLSVQHYWALCRNPTDLDPLAAWKIFEMNMSPMDHWF